jgi:hypothetical protein
MLVLSFATAGVAAAATTPEFKPVPAKKKFTSTGGAVKWTYDNGSETMTCTKSTATGEVTGVKTVGKLVVKFTGCTTSGSGKSGCAANSAGRTGGEIVTNALEGELGTVKTAEAASGVGLLLKPETGKTWTTLVGDECTAEAKITGTVAAEVATVGKKQATNKLVLSDPSGKQAIHSITLDSGTVERPELVMFGTAMTLEASDETTFEEALEVT